MKKINIIFIKIMINATGLFFLLFFSSCNDENSVGNEDYQFGDISGEWHLISFECCDLPQEEYSRDEVIWIFDHEAQRLTIENNTTFDMYSEYIFQVSGSYNYSLSDSILSISYNDSDRKYDLSLVNESMILSQNPESDGPFLTFKR